MANLRPQDIQAMFDDAHGETHGHVRTKGRKGHSGHKGGTNDGAEMAKSADTGIEVLTPAQLHKRAKDAAKQNLRMAGLIESNKHAARVDARKDKKLKLKDELAATRQNKEAVKLSSYAAKDPAFAARLQAQQGGAAASQQTDGGSEPQMS